MLKEKLLSYFLRLSISGKILLLITLLLFLISATIFLYIPAKVEEQQIVSTRLKAKMIAEIMAYNVAPALIFNDSLGINEQLTGVQSNPEMVFVKIVSPYLQGSSISNNKPSADKYTLGEEQKLLISNDGIVMKYSTPVMHNGMQIGELIAGISLAEFRKSVNAIKGAVTIFSLLIFLLGTLGVYFINRLVTRPLKSIVNAADSIARGNFMIRADVSARDEIGSLAKAFNSMLDVIDQDRENLEMLNKQLEAIVDVRTKELQQEIERRKKYEIELISEKEKAEEVNHLKNIILTNLSHELKTPLNGIIGLSEVLEQSVGEVDIELVRSIHESGNRLLESFNSILDLAMLESNSFKYNKLEQIDAVFFIQRLLPNIRLDSAAKKLELKLDIPSLPLFVRCTAYIFSLIVQHLVDNAIKFTHEGSISLSLQPGRGEYNKYVLLEIADTGIGIDKADQSIIFEEFRQVSEGLNRKYQGVGLGLTIVKKLVKMCGGFITVISTPGEGSTFTVYFPLPEESE